MRRRDFIKAIAGSGAVWPLTVRAQQPARVRIIGATTSLSQDDPEDKARIAAFRQSLQELGWTVGGNVRIEYRYGSGNAERIRKNAAELVALAPDVILVTGTPSLEHHHASGPEQAPGDLLGTFLRRCRRPDLLRGSHD
jgi:putative tryptophan/tyrosine transport system substrate-binding protein